MPKPIRKGKPKMVYVMPVHQNMLQRLIDEKGVSSEAEAFRQALVFFYEKKFPLYAEETADQELKRRKLKKVMDTESMSPEEYVLAHAKGSKIYQASNGGTYVILRAMGNSYRVVPLDDFKDFHTNHSIFLEDHAAQITQRGPLSLQEDTDWDEVVNKYLYREFVIAQEM